MLQHWPIFGQVRRRKKRRQAEVVFQAAVSIFDRDMGDGS